MRKPPLIKDIWNNRTNSAQNWHGARFNLCPEAIYKLGAIVINTWAAKSEGLARPKSASRFSILNTKNWPELKGTINAFKDTYFYADFKYSCLYSMFEFF